MIRPFTLADALLLLGVKGQDWVMTPSALLAQGAPSSARVLLVDRPWLRRHGGAWTAVVGRHPRGVASARPAWGPSCWLVDHLVTLSGDPSPCADLLEVVAGHACRQRAERLLLRLLDDWRLVDVARHAGFSLCTGVLAFTLPGRRALLGVEPLSEFRERLPQDDYPLFRLYHASTPAGVRSAMGMTLQQWKDAQDSFGKPIQELVLEQQGVAKAWVRLSRGRKWVWARTAIHPEWEGDLRRLVALVMVQAASRTVLWEVPVYNVLLRTALERTGFELAGFYQLMVRPLTAPVRKPALVPAKVV